VQWIQSYETGDKVCCVYISSDEAIIRQHAGQGGFPVITASAESNRDRPDCRGQLTE
jgi:hypothetical protein